MGKLLHNRVNRHELKQRMLQTDIPYTTISFYKYARIQDPKQFRDTLYLQFQEVGVLGRIYIAEEGINAQIAVPTAQMEAFKAILNQYDMFHGLRLNIAVDDNGKSFFALIIKVREKIVADGIDDPDFDPANHGQHLKAAEWNHLSAQENTIIVDMRNHYESEVGYFKSAITPDVATFREELPFVAELLADKKDQNILMYCTGGIRCEKASAYMKYRGFQNVYQLEGGIIEYARQVQANGLENKFIGKNFVFDERLGERISEDVVAHCHQCGTASDRHINCKNDYCHILFIQCEHCAQTYENCCSHECREFMLLTPDERKIQSKSLTFNGSKFGKGIYKAFRKSAQSLRSSE